MAAACSRSSGASCSSSAARARSEPRDRVADVPQCRGGQHPAACGERGDFPDVADPFERRLLGDVEQRDRLGRQRLPPRHLARIGRRDDCMRELGAVFGRGRPRDAVCDRRELQRFESERIHRPSVGSPALDVSGCKPF